MLTFPFWSLENKMILFSFICVKIVKMYRWHPGEDAPSAQKWFSLSVLFFPNRAALVDWINKSVLLPFQQEWNYVETVNLDSITLCVCFKLYIYTYIDINIEGIYKRMLSESDACYRSSEAHTHTHTHTDSDPLQSIWCSPIHLGRAQTSRNNKHTQLTNIKSMFRLFTFRWLRFTVAKKERCLLQQTFLFTTLLKEDWWKLAFRYGPTDRPSCVSVCNKKDFSFFICLFTRASQKSPRHGLLSLCNLPSFDL